MLNVSFTNDDTPPALESTIRAHLQRYFAAHEGHLPPSGLHARILALTERPLIEECLRATSGNQLKAAELLGINRNTLRAKIKALGIDTPKSLHDLGDRATARRASGGYGGRLPPSFKNTKERT